MQHKVESQPSVTPQAQSRICGSESGRIRRLSGFQKSHHLPDNYSDAAQAFVRRIGQNEVKEAADRLYGDIRQLFGYKRREFDYSCEDGMAWIKTPDFDLQLTIDLSPDCLKEYTLKTEIHALHSEAIAADPRFHNCFTHHCDRLIVEFAHPVHVADKIDLIEDIDELEGCLSYEPDCSAFELKLIDLDLHIHVDTVGITFSLLTLRNLSQLLEHSQKAFDILSDCDFGMERILD